jgi:hypothetical protein
MKPFDIAAFEVGADLQKRLGFARIYSTAKDISISQRSSGAHMPTIVSSMDPGALITAAREPEVIGIMPQGPEPSRKAIEKAAEYGKTIFIPVGGFTETGTAQRQLILRSMRKTFFAAHSLKARACIISLAASKNQLLSAGQLKGIANLISTQQGRPAILENRIT